MIGAFRKLFGLHDDLARLARGTDRAIFLQRLGKSAIQIVAAPEGDGLDPRALTREQLLAEVDRAAKDLNKRAEGFAPLVYERERRRRLPFFTSDDHAKAFVAAYSQERDRIYPYQLLTVQGTLLVRMIPACDVFVMNDRSADEILLDDADRAAMQRAWG